MRILKRVLKRTAQTALAAVGPERLHAGAGPTLLVVTYHRVLPESDPERRTEQPGMYVSPQTLDMHLGELKSRFELMHLSRWVKRARAGEPLPRRACAITFDDGWRDNYEHAFPVLRKHEAPATIFVVSEFVGSRYRFWPNRLARLLTSLDRPALARLLSSDAGRWLAALDLDFDPAAQTGLDAAMADRIIEQAKRYTETELQAKLDAMEAEFGAADDGTPDMVDWDQLREMQAGGLVEVGSHTGRHTRLVAGLDAAAMHEEIEHSKQTIEQRLETGVETFCYPNGDYTPAAVEAVSRAYAAACTTQKGWNNARSNPWLLKRIGVHEDISADRRAFLARLSGYL